MRAAGCRPRQLRLQVHPTLGSDSPPVMSASTQSSDPSCWASGRKSESASPPLPPASVPSSDESATASDALRGRAFSRMAACALSA